MPILPNNCSAVDIGKGRCHIVIKKANIYGCTVIDSGVVSLRYQIYYSDLLYIVALAKNNSFRVFGLHTICIDIGEGSRRDSLHYLWYMCVVPKPPVVCTMYSISQ